MNVYACSCLAALLLFFGIMVIVCVEGYRFLIVKQNYKVIQSLKFYLIALLLTLFRIMQYFDYAFSAFGGKFGFDFGENIAVMAIYFEASIGFIQCSSMQILQIKLRAEIEQFEKNLSEDDAASKVTRLICYVNLFSLFIVVTGIAFVTLYYVTDFGTYLCAGYLLFLVVDLIVSFVGLYKVINYLFDGKLSEEFKLLRSTYFLLTIAYFLGSLYFCLFEAFY